MPGRVRQPALRGFAIVMGLAAVGAGAAVLAMAAALQNETLFERLLAVVARLYSRAGSISPAGIDLIRQAAGAFIRVGSVVTLGAGIAGGLLWRLAHQPVVADPVRRQRSGPAAGRQWPGIRGGLIVVAGLVAIAGLIRIPRLSTSLFYDEIVTIQRFAGLPLARIPLAQVESNNHVLNSVLLHFMLRISSAEAWLRLPVYFFGLGSLWLLFLLGRRLGGPWAGLFAVWLAATSSYHVWYSTLARGYMAGLFFCLLGFVALLREPWAPSRRARWIFGISHVLASLALPTLAMVPLLLCAGLLAGSWPQARAVTGIDPRSPSGASWLVTSLWTLTVIALFYLPMAPHIAMRMRNTVVGGPLSEGAMWLGSLQRGPVLAAATLAVAGAGLWRLIARQAAAGRWAERFVLLVFAASAVLFVVQPVPGRIHVTAFVAVVVLAALGLSAVLSRLMRAMAPGRRAALAPVAALVTLAGLTAASWPEMVAALEAAPMQDVRQAVRFAEDVLPAHGIIATSGYSGDEIGYYASRPVVMWTSADTPAAWIGAGKPFCYFRLYAYPRYADPVYDYFERSGNADVVIGGEDPLAIWCVPDGHSAS